MKEKTYTAPAVVSCADAVQNTKAVSGLPRDGSAEDPGDDTPAAIGFYL